MKTRWLKFRKSNWDLRSAQERTLLKIFTLALLPLLIYFVLWQPAHNAVAKLHVSVPYVRMAAETLRAQAGEVEMLRHRPKLALLDAAAIKATIEDSVSRNNIREAISTLDVQLPNAVRISFSSVSFDLWLRWLRELQQEQKIRADSVSLVMLPQSGMVKISATLVNGAAQ
jgi:general secretion pathway protein M